MRLLSLIAVLLMTLAIWAAATEASRDPGAPRSSLAHGESLFQTSCAQCHGSDGSANTEMGRETRAADLRSRAVQSKPDADLREVIENGKGAMPAFAGQLSSGDVQDVLLFIRSFRHKAGLGH